MTEKVIKTFGPIKIYEIGKQKFIDPIQPKICGLPEKMANGYVFCKTSDVEVQCHFYCKSGY